MLRPLIHITPNELPYLPHLLLIIKVVTNGESAAHYITVHYVHSNITQVLLTIPVTQVKVRIFPRDADYASVSTSNEGMHHPRASIKPDWIVLVGKKISPKGEPTNQGPLTNKDQKKHSGHPPIIDAIRPSVWHPERKHPKTKQRHRTTYQRCNRCTNHASQTIAAIDYIHVSGIKTDYTVPFGATFISLPRQPLQSLNRINRPVCPEFRQPTCIHVNPLRQAIISRALATSIAWMIPAPARATIGASATALDLSAISNGAARALAVDCPC